MKEGQGKLSLCFFLEKNIWWVTLHSRATRVVLRSMPTPTAPTWSVLSASSLGTSRATAPSEFASMSRLVLRLPLLPSRQFSHVHTQNVNVARRCWRPWRGAQFEKNNRNSPPKRIMMCCVVDSKFKWIKKKGKRCAVVGGPWCSAGVGRDAVLGWAVMQCWGGLWCMLGWAVTLQPVTYIDRKKKTLPSKKKILLKKIVLTPS